MTDASDFLPARESLKALREAAAGCRGCDLYEDAIQTVFGEGRKAARVMLVGETPGDQEDRQGKPFVGPAGRELDKALARAGIDRADAYVTNAVKHFRFEERGKRRIHQKPEGRHIKACRPWLEAELRQIRPEAVIVMGATAARSLLGPAFRVTRSRGQLMPWPASAQHPEDFPVADIQALATIHPSAVLRADDRDAAYQGLVDDLKVAASAVSR